MTTQSKQEELNGFMKKFRSNAHVNFRQDGETIAYGWKPTEMKREVQALINSEILAVLEELEKQDILQVNNLVFGGRGLMRHEVLSAIQTIKERYL